MRSLTIEWQEANKLRVEQIRECQPSKNPGTVRIGRNPTQCDIVLRHPTVSGLHVEIFFDRQQECFYLRNLRYSNPPLVNGKNLSQGALAITQGSTIYLGEIALEVVSENINYLGNDIPLTMPALSNINIKDRSMATPKTSPANETIEPEYLSHWQKISQNIKNYKSEHPSELAKGIGNRE
jgi:predicted component of type VI protein secretion system